MDAISKKRWDKYLVAAIGIVAVYRLVFFMIYEPYVLYNDSGGYMNYPWRELFSLQVTSGRVPLYPAFLAILQKLVGGNYLVAVSVVQNITSLISLVYLYKTFTILDVNRKIACAVLVLYGCNPGVYVWNAAILTESLALSMTAIFLYLIIYWIHTPNLKTGVILCSFLLIMVFFRPTFLLFAALTGAFLVIRFIFFPEERAMLVIMFAVLAGVLAVVICYSISFRQWFGYYSISDALPRQNVISMIERKYYIGSPVQEEIEQLYEASNGSQWNTMVGFLANHGEIEANRIANNLLYGDLVRYAKDTLRIIFKTISGRMGGSYIFFRLKEKYDIAQALAEISKLLAMENGWVYLACGTNLVLFIRGCLKKCVLWVSLGLGIFMLLIVVSTYMATCGEFDRTMIHILPFVYITGAQILDKLIHSDFSTCEKN